MNTVAAQQILADTDNGSAIATAVIAVVMFIFSLALYLLPGFIATARDLPNQGSVWVINIFLGWTFIGWVVALAMAVAGNRPSTQFPPPAAYGPPAPAKVATKKCPDCAETVLSDAKVCKYCGHHFAPSAPDTPQKRPRGKSTKVKCHHCQHVQMVPINLSTFVCEQCNTKLRRRTG